MNKVYLVVGWGGEYDDFSEWNVKAFADKEKADALVTMLVDWHKNHRPNSLYSNTNSPYDPNSRNPYGIPSYGVEELDYEGN